MANQYFNRYDRYEIDGKFKFIPFIKLSVKSTDKYEIYKDGVTRLDKLSQKYYNNPTYGWLIQLANPQFGGLEFDFYENLPIRIPFPLISTLQEYQDKVDEEIRLNGV
jgi:hypothetical protein